MYTCQMISVKNNTGKVLFWIGILAILLIPSLGLIHFNMQMGMDGKMSMSDCPFMVGSSLCTMTPLQHISIWRNMFTTLPSQDTILQFFLIFSTFVFCFIFFRQVFSPPKNSFYLSRNRYLRYIFPTNYLREAFSSGILNPKLF